MSAITDFLNDYAAEHGIKPPDWVKELEEPWPDQLEKESLVGRVDG